MSSSNHYDENLLGAAPKATREQRQEGYNIDLLNQSRTRQDVKSTPPALTPRSTDVEAAMQPSKEGFVAANGGGRSHTPFLQSTKGKIIILIAAIVIVGAVVGGAVGGTVGKHKSHSFLATTTSGSPFTTTRNASASASTSASSAASISSETQGQNTGAPGPVATQGTSGG